MFKGEDISYRDCRRKQQEQVHDFLSQQILEKRLECDKETNEFLNWEKTIKDQNKIALQLEKLETANSKQRIIDLKNDNKMLALQNKEKNLRQKIVDDIQNRRDIETNLYGPLLNEDFSLVRRKR